MNPLENKHLSILCAAIALMAVALAALLFNRSESHKTIRVDADHFSKKRVWFKLDQERLIISATVKKPHRTIKIGDRRLERAIDKGWITVRVSNRKKRKKLRDYKLILTIVTNQWEPPTQPPTQPPFMIISRDRLDSLPTSGSAYDYMKGRADAAMANMNLTSNPDATSPWLTDYNGSGQVTRPATQTLAAALIYARTGDQQYKDFVIDVNRYVIGTEGESSLDGTDQSGALLATARQIGAYVVSADLVGMDPDITGSRAGWRSMTWKDWLSDLRTKPIGTSGQASDLTELADERANNWGSFARAALTSIDIYLDDTNALNDIVERYKLSLGERQQTDSFKWIEDQDFDENYVCLPGGSDPRWMAINPSGCGDKKDGLIVEDISRSANTYPSYDDTGIGYTMESYQAMLFTAVLLERQGYDPFDWGDQALKRVMDWLDREDREFGDGYSTEKHESWIANYFYSRNYPTQPALMGRTFGFTDWLYPAS